MRDYISRTLRTSGSGFVNITRLYVCTPVAGDPADAGPAGGGGEAAAGVGGVAAAAAAEGASVQRVAPRVMRAMLGVDAVRAGEVAAEVALPDGADVLGAPPPPPGGRQRRVLVLDGVQDPSNVGALVRSAACLGWDGVVLTAGGTADAYGDRALRASAGAAMHLPLQVCARAGALDLVWFGLNACSPFAAAQRASAAAVAALAGAADTVSLIADAAAGRGAGGGGGGAEPPPSPEEEAVAFGHLRASLAASPRLLLVVSGEGGRASAAVAAECSRVGIPMARGLDSLNVGVAGAILMHMLGPAPSVVVPEEVAVAGGEAPAGGGGAAGDAR